MKTIKITINSKSVITLKEVTAYYFNKAYLEVRNEKSKKSFYRLNTVTAVEEV